MQVYLDDDQDEQLARRAAGAGVTKSTLIRQALDAFLNDPAEQGAGVARFRAMLAEVRRDPVTFEDGASYVEQHRSADLIRRVELGRRRS